MKALNNIEKKNRKFYEFYQEVRKILGATRDLHFFIYGFQTPKGTKFNYMTACLPFSFYVEKDEDFKPRIYIKYFPSCAQFFSEKIREIVQEKADKKIPLELINEKDPFEYIQNWGQEYLPLKSPHAQFTNNKNSIYIFSIVAYPYDAKELSMKFKFKNEEEILELDYYIYLPNFREMNRLLGSNILSEEEFDEFYESERKKHLDNVKMPNIFEMINKYKKKKGIKIEEEKENSKIEWDFQTEDNHIKCRVDYNNRINVMVQDSFNIDYSTALKVISKCVQKFHENNYTIVVIENNNGGGSGDVSCTLSQLIQIKMQNREYLAYKPIEYINQKYKYSPEYFYDLDTCKPFDSFEDFLNGTTANYSTETETILHNKTKIVDVVNYYRRMELYEKRKEFYKLNLKRSTDIIIFTDTYSFSATSFFIKGLQETGAAILVGYFGNPKSDEVMDASQSPSFVGYFPNTDVYKNLKEVGILIRGVTIYESYNYNQYQLIRRSLFYIIHLHHHLHIDDTY